MRQAPVETQNVLFQGRVLSAQDRQQRNRALILDAVDRQVQDSEGSVCCEKACQLAGAVARDTVAIWKC